MSERAQTKVFKAAAWRTDQPLHDQRTLMKTWGHTDVEVLVLALLKYEDEWMHSNVSSKRHNCQFVDILNPSGEYPANMRMPNKPRLSDVFSRPLSTFLTGYRALDALARWIYPEKIATEESPLRLNIQRHPVWPGNAAHWRHMQNLEENVKTCISLLKKVAALEPLGIDQETDVGEGDTILEAVAARLLTSRKRLVESTRGTSLLTNLEGSALGLNMLLRGDLDIRSLSKCKDSAKIEPETMIGPLLGALFIDPLWAITTISMTSFCDEEILVELDELNAGIFRIIHKTAIGQLQGSTLIKTLLDLLESDRAQVVVREYRHFYRLHGPDAVEPQRLSAAHPKLYEIRQVNEEDESPSTYTAAPEHAHISQHVDPREDQDPSNEGKEAGVPQERPNEGDEMQVDPPGWSNGVPGIGSTSEGKSGGTLEVDTANGGGSSSDDEPLAKRLNPEGGAGHGSKGGKRDSTASPGSGNDSGEEPLAKRQKREESAGHGDEGGSRDSTASPCEPSDDENDQLDSSEDETKKGGVPPKTPKTPERSNADNGEPVKTPKTPERPNADSGEPVETPKTPERLNADDGKSVKIPGSTPKPPERPNEDNGKPAETSKPPQNPNADNGKPGAEKHDEQLNFFHDMHDVARSCFHDSGRIRLKPRHLSSASEDSMLSLITEEGYNKSSPDRIRKVLGEGKVVIIDDCADRGESFSPFQLRWVHNLDKKISVQDQSVLPDPDYRCWERASTLREIFNEHMVPDHKQRSLNALNFPNYSAGPKEYKLGVDERIWKATNFIYGFKEMLYPSNSVNWSIVGLPGACHGWHNDSEGFGTFVTIRSGLKWWVVGRSAESGEKLDFFLESPDFDPWLVDDSWDVEAILLKPGTRIIMPPGMLHAVFTIKSSVCTGGHYYLWETMEHTIHALIRSTIMSHQIINTENYAAESRQILLRMMGFLHEEMIMNYRTHDDDPDLPSLKTTEHWIALSAFFCLIKLFNIISIGTYRVTNEHHFIERRDMVWGRGLMEHSMDVLSKLYQFDFEKELFDPMLGHYVFHIKKAFADTYPPGAKISFSSPFFTKDVRSIFTQQLEWILETRPRARNHLKRMAKIDPAPTLVRYTDWEMPEELSLKDDEEFPDRWSNKEYFRKGVHSGDTMFFNSLCPDSLD
ncbi:hypothetical protein EST38_g10577 [Candolleomyces aberdarensis]|uniref:JmjC domain-containing protein n=1 Tax=Candolleomyces aberdarensis TaxID=2316362 RepID=A0A4Q2D7R5_9AGAR|nr:hypothetical protein EST38_g10577 [Candolleomyces aberdarensis]